MNGTRYTDKTYIGSGGMASVYKAYDTVLERFVAIKEVADQFKDNAEVRAMFLREARRMAQIRDPNVVQVYDVIEDEQAPMILMEFLSGGSMASRLGELSLTPDEALDILEQVVSGLKSIHEAGVVHRDLKPENILRDEATFKITDFGVAMSGDEDILPFVTNRYAAPEILLDPANITPSTDLYSLGVMTIELILGTERFEELVKETIAGDEQIHVASIKGSAQAFWQQWIASPAELPLLNTIDHTISPDVAQFLAHLTRRDPAARPRDCAEVLTELKKLRLLEARRQSAATEYDPKIKRMMEKKQKEQAAQAARSAATEPTAAVAQGDKAKKKTPLWFKLLVGVGCLLLAAIATLFLWPSPGPSAPPRFALALVTTPPGATVTVNGQAVEAGPTPVSISSAWGDSVKLEMAGMQPVELTLSEGMPGLSESEAGRQLAVAMVEAMPINTSAEAAAALAAAAENPAALEVSLSGFNLTEGHYSVVVGTPLHFAVKAAGGGELTVLHLGSDDAATLLYPSPQGKTLSLVPEGLVVGPELDLVSTEPLGKEWMVFILSEEPLSMPDIIGFQRVRDWGRRYPFGGMAAPGRTLVLWLLDVLGQDGVSAAIVETDVVYRLGSP